MNNEWQLIETAPKDGRRIEALVDGKPEIVFWGKVSHLNWWGWILSTDDPENADLCVPTEWNPAKSLKHSIALAMISVA